MNGILDKFFNKQLHKSVYFYFIQLQFATVKVFKTSHIPSNTSSVTLHATTSALHFQQYQG